MDLDITIDPVCAAVLGSVKTTLTKYGVPILATFGAVKTYDLQFKYKTYNIQSN